MLKIIIPAAGNGQRFADEGYAEPKPLIPVVGVPMIKRVIDNLSPNNADASFYVISRKEHGLLESEIPSPQVTVYALDHKTQGAVSTVMEAERWIDDSPLIIANCDQLILGLDMDDFLDKMKPYDAGAITFNSTNPHHSYMKVSGGRVTQVAEKVVISDHAVAGIYYYRSGLEFLKYARRMIDKDIRYNGEFYISPLFNEYIEDGKEVGMYEVGVDQKHMLGTPMELRIFLDKIQEGVVTL
jgi:dTDP-glucose pyrophosphorylase